jgi:hypothetical protein
MARSRGARVYELYERLPEGIRRRTDGAIKFGVKSTKGFRDRKTIEARGKAWVAAQKRNLTKMRR